MIQDTVRDQKQIKKSFTEDFSKLFDDPNRVNFVNFFKNHTGEHNEIDFKKEWLEVPKLAKHVLGFANAGGGILIFGAQETEDKSIEPVGLDILKEKTEIKNFLARYLPSELEFDIFDFVYGDESEWKKIKNKKFQILIVEDKPEYLPYLSLCASNDVLHKNRVYFRGKTNTEVANQEELKKILNRRLETQISTKSEDEFRNKISQLKILYSFIGKKVQMDFSFMLPLQVDNPNYPKEDFDEFIVRMIEKTKKIIENS